MMKIRTALAVRSIRTHEVRVGDVIQQLDYASPDLRTLENRDGIALTVTEVRDSPRPGADADYAYTHGVHPRGAKWLYGDARHVDAKPGGLLDGSNPMHFEIISNWRVLLVNPAADDPRLAAEHQERLDRADYESAMTLRRRDRILRSRNSDGTWIDHPEPALAPFRPENADELNAWEH